MPIRWKLILGVGVPLALMLAALMLYDFNALRREAFRLASERTADLAQRYAASLEADCRAIEQVGRGTVRLLESLPDPSEAQLYDILARNVESNPLIYGSCVAYEPGGFAGARSTDKPPSLLPQAAGPRPRPNPALFCPYVFRHPGGLQRMDVADAYDYLDPRWEWYRYPRETGQAFWTEPFFDEGAGNAMMVTFVAPFFRDGVFRGTVNMDVLISDLRARTFREVRPGVNVYLISRRGTVIVAPQAEFSGTQSALNAADALERPDLRRIVERMIAQEEGAEPVRAIEGDAEQVLFFAPVRSPRWSLGGLIEKRQVMWQVYAALSRRGTVNVAAGVLLLFVVLALGAWVVRPVGRLAEAVGRLSGGNLDARVEGVRARDEIGQLARAYNGMLDQLKTHVTALTAATKAREAVESELRVARAIQLSLLPRQFPGDARYRVFGVNAPAKLVGGDFYDVFVGGDGLLTLVIADVSGKGVGAAMFMAVARTVVRDLASAPGLQPADVIRRANAVLLENNSEGMFVTMFVAQYDPATGRINYVNAGHPPPLVADNAGGVRRFGAATGTIVGALDGIAYEQREGNLIPGERLVCYTDGVTEARAPGGEMYGEPRFTAWLAGRGGADPSELCQSGVGAVDVFQANERADDVTFLVLERIA